MKTRTLISWTVSLVIFVVLVTTAFAKEVRSSENHEISVGEYVTFLNAVAGESDEYGLYDLEALGKEIVAQEDFFLFRKSNRVFYRAAERIDPTCSLFGLTELQALRYCNWIENGSQKALPKALATTETGSYDLTGNEIVVNDGAQHHVISDVLHPGCFIITTRSSNGEEPILPEQATDPLMMSGFGEHGKKSSDKRGHYNPIDQNDLHHANEGGEVDNHSSTTSRRDLSQGGIAEGESEIDSSQKNPDTSQPLHPNQLTLDHFRAALEAHPEAERFVIVTHPNGTYSIEPESADPTAPGRNRGENIDIIRKLRELIPSEVDDNNADHPLRITKGMTTTVDPLSAPRLRRILAIENHPQAVPLREQIQSQMKETIKNTVMLHVATDQLKEKQEIKQILATNYPDVDWDSSSEIDSFITEQLSNKYKRDLALRLHDEAVSDTALLAQVPVEGEGIKKEVEQNLEIRRQDHQKKVRRYAWSDRNFGEWELPGELPEIVLPPGDADIVVVPEMLHDKAEALGRRLIAEANQLGHFHEEKVENNTVSSSLNPATMSSNPSDLLINWEEQIKNEIIDSSLNPSEENRNTIEQRLAARAKANELWRQAAALAKESQLLREEKAAGGEKTSPSDEKRSMLSSMSSNIFGAFSKANTVTRVISGGMFVDSETARLLADSAEKVWEGLALEAEKTRSQKSDASLGKETILEIWEKADQELLALNQKKNAAQNLQASWQANTMRWQLSVKLEQAFQELRQKEESLISAQDYRSIINGRHLRGKATKEEKKEASESMKMAAEEVDAAHLAASEAEEAWKEVTLQHESVRSYSNNSEQERALEKLGDSDQAVVNLWFKLTDLYSKDEKKEETMLTDSQVRIKEESDHYALKRKMDLARYFGETSELGSVATRAKTIYRSGDKTAAKFLYDRLDVLRIKAHHDYMEVAKQDALESARKRLPEMASFWAKRMSEAAAEQRARTTAATLKQRSADGWADETQQALEHATAIVAAEETAFKIYQEEEKRLNNIETLWIAIIAAKKEALRARPAKAAEAYFVGDPTAWSNLSADERERYNQDMREANKMHEAPFEGKIEIAKEQVASAKDKIKKAIVYTSSADAKALQDAEALLAKLQAEDAERKKMIRLAQLPKDEQKEVIKEEVYPRRKKELEERLDILQQQAETANQAAIIAFDHANNTSTGDATSLWNEATQKRKKATVAWTNVTKWCEQSLCIVPRVDPDFPWWKEKRETAEDMKNQNAALVLRYTADKANSLAIVASDKAFAAPAAEKSPLYDEAIARRREVELAWEEVLKALRQGLSLVPAHRNDLKTWWKERIEEAEDLKNQNAALVLWYTANKAIILAIVASDKAFAAPAAEKSPLFDEAITRREEAVTAWDEVLENLVQRLAALPEHREDLKTWWKNQIETAENIKNKNAALVLWYTANKANSLAIVAESKASAAPAAEADPLYNEAITRREEAVTAWDEVLENLVQRLAALPEHRENLKTWWKNQIETAENSKNQNAALVLRYTADKASSLAIVASDKANAAPAAEKSPLYDEAIARRREVEAAHDQALKAYTQGLSLVPANRDDLKTWWKKQIETAENLKNQNAALVLGYTANKATSLAIVAKDKAFAAPAAEKSPLYDEAIARRREAIAAWDQALKAYTKGLLLVPANREDLKTWWQEHFIHNFHQRTRDLFEDEFSLTINLDEMLLNLVENSD